MGIDRFSSGSGWRRGIVRVAALCLLLCAALVAAAGCGGSGDADAEAEKASDTEILNAALARELTLLDAYTRGRQLLRGRMRAAGREFRAHEQEYVDAITKAIRGLGGETDAEPGDLELSEIQSRGDFLGLAYELESAALASYVEAAPRLFTDAPQTLAASLAAGHAQRLVLIRQGMGAEPAAAAPEAFDGGEVPPPGG